LYEFDYDKFEQDFMASMQTQQQPYNPQPFHSQPSYTQPYHSPQYRSQPYDYDAQHYTQPYNPQPYSSQPYHSPQYSQVPQNNFASGFGCENEFDFDAFERGFGVASPPSPGQFSPPPQPPPQWPTQWDLPDNMQQQPVIEEDEEDEDVPLKQKSAAMKTLNMASSVIFYGVMIAIVLGVAMFSMSSNPNLTFMGYRAYAVRTPSMTPQEDSPPGGFRAGDMIIVQVVQPRELNVGDVVTFMPSSDPNVYLTHRVVEIKHELNGQRHPYYPDPNAFFLVTHGDANPSRDPPIRSETVVGRSVFVIPRVGAFVEFAQANIWLILVIIGSGVGSIALLKVYLRQPAPSKKHNRNKATQ